METIGFKIRKLREERNISREQMAELLQTSLRTYAKIETNENEPSLKQLRAIAKELEVDEQDLLYGNPRMVFENCTNQSFYNSGTIHFQSMEEMHNHYEALLAQKKTLSALIRKSTKNKVS